MNSIWPSNIARLITILATISLYAIAVSSIFRFKKRNNSNLNQVHPPLSEAGEKTPVQVYTDTEKRVYPRVKLETNVRYKPYGEKGRVYIFKEGRTKNISESGMRLETYEKLALETKLEFKLRCPYTPQFVLAKGKIVWSREINKGKWYHYGISFTEISPNDKKMIADYIYSQSSNFIENEAETE